jgi:anti-sigma regulatory factor (Ser/Thr protein kinase)
MRFGAERDQLPKMLDWITGEAAQALPPEEVNKIRLACEELLVNIIDYAYPDQQSHPVDIDLVPRSHEVEITIRDSGIPFDPLKKADPDVSAPPTARQIGGLGIFLAKHLMDKMEYQRLGNENVIKITKHEDKS